MADFEAEDRKPQSDEARSAFTQPLGVVAPQRGTLDDESSTTSEFAIPTGHDTPRTIG